MKLVDEFDGGLGWIEDEPMARTSHALEADGGWWLVDPVEPVPEAVGEVRGVIQLLDRHKRDCGALATRLGVPHVHAYAGAGANAAFETVPVLQRRFWREAALWWPERRVLVVADALGTIGFFRAGDEPIGVHPLLRLFPPRRLAAYEPERILVGHGAGVHENAAAALAEALSTSRRRAPAAAAQAVAQAVRARRTRRRPR